MAGVRPRAPAAWQSDAGVPGDTPATILKRFFENCSNSDNGKLISSYPLSGKGLEQRRTIRRGSPDVISDKADKSPGKGDYCIKSRKPRLVTAEASDIAAN